MYIYKILQVFWDLLDIRRIMRVIDSENGF